MFIFTARRLNPSALHPLPLLHAGVVILLRILEGGVGGGDWRICQTSGVYKDLHRPPARQKVAKVMDISRAVQTVSADEVESEKLKQIDLTAKRLNWHFDQHREAHPHLVISVHCAQLMMQNGTQTMNFSGQFNYRHEK